MMTTSSRRSSPIRVISSGLNLQISKWVMLATTSFLRIAIKRSYHRKLLLSQIVKWRSMHWEIQSFKLWHLVWGLFRINPETLRFLSQLPLSLCNTMKKFRSKLVVDRTQSWNILIHQIYCQTRQGRAWRIWNKKIQNQSETEIS